MRLFLLSIILIASAIASNSYAATFEQCQQKEKDAAGLRTCIEAERHHAANLLRDQNVESFAAVEATAKKKHDKAFVNQFRAEQARHVRVRKNTCHKKHTTNEQVACEADMDFAHIEKLKRYTQE